MAATSVSTPINKITRDNLTVLIRNNILDDSVEFASDNDMMETDSPVRSKNLQPISKKLFQSPMQSPDSKVYATRYPETRKLFHSPMQSSDSEVHAAWYQGDRSRRNRKRKQFLIPDGNERFKRAYIECEDGFSEEGGMRKKVLISLFHNKEYSMDVGI